MSNIIDKIRLSGTDYTLSATTSGVSVVEVTQAEYDALPSSAKTDTSKMYVITDAQAGDLSQYWTSAQTSSAITEAVSGKVDTTTFNAYSGSVETALSGKQDTLVSGTNIKTINNTSILGSGNINIQGGGGGKAIEAGRGISVTTGETADTVSFNLPISADTDGSINKLLVGDGNTIGSDTYKNIVIGDNNTTFGGNDDRIYSGATIIGYNNEVGNNGLQNSSNDWSVAIGRRNKINGGNTYIIGVDNSFKDSFVQKKNYTYVFGRANSGNSLTSDSQNIFVFGAYNKVTKSNEFALGEYNVSSNDGTTSGNTFFSIGNGTADNARHNAFEIRQNGDIYLSSGGTDIKLQDHLGGGGGGGTTYSAGTNIDITNDTINCTLPIREGSNSSGKGIIVGDSECTANGLYGISLGHSSDADGAYSFCNGSNSYARGQMSFAYGSGCDAKNDYAFMLGSSNESTKQFQFSYGRYVKPKNELEFGFGTYNNSSSASTTFGHSGNTLFSIGNGYDFSSTHNWHNAFEVRQNGDIYIPNTNDTSVTGDYAYSLYPMVKLQDVLDSKQTTLTAGTGISIVDNVISATGGGGGGGMTEDDELLLATALTDLNGRKIDASEVKSNYQKKGDYVTTNTLNTRLAEYETALDEQNVEEVTAYALNDLNNKFGGLKFVKITESEYAALTTKDENTLYIVVADPS